MKLRYDLGTPNELLLLIMDDAFSTDVDTFEVEVQNNPSRPIDDVLMEEVKAYKQQMSRWVKASFEAARVPECWVMMELCEAAKAPLDHCLAAHESKPSEAHQRLGRATLSSFGVRQGSAHL